MNKLNHLLELKDGWYNGEGTKYNKNFVDKVEKIFYHYIDSYQDLIFYPSVDGNIYMECLIKNWIVSIDIADNLETHFHAMKVYGDKIENDIKEFNCNLNIDYHDINEEIEKLYEEL